MGILDPPPPYPGLSGTSKSPKTPGRDFDDICSLCKLPYDVSWWNFQWSFPGIFLVPWHHLQLHQEHPFPPRLQEVTWRIGGFLTNFQMLDLDETFGKTSLGYIEYLDTISNSTKNIPVLPDSRKRLGGQVESWQACWCYETFTRFVSGLILTKSWPKVGTIILTFSEPYYTRNWKNLNNWMENFWLNCILKFKLFLVNDA